MQRIYASGSPPSRVSGSQPRVTTVQCLSGHFRRVSRRADLFAPLFDGWFDATVASAPGLMVTGERLTGQLKSCPLNWPDPVKLIVMRRSNNPTWVLVCGFALTLLLGAAYQPQFGSNPATGMAAPSAPRIAINSGAVQKLPQTQFDGSALERRAGSPEFLTSSSRLDEFAGRVICSARYYGPLHRRPPPGLS